MRYLLALTALLALSCKKTKTGSWINAEVINARDAACSQPVLSFREDSAAVRSLTGKQALEYLGLELPESLRNNGQKVRVQVRLPQDGEQPFCLGIGLAHPALVVTEAKGR